MSLSHITSAQVVTCTRLQDLTLPVGIKLFNFSFYLSKCFRLTFPFRSDSSSSPFGNNSAFSVFSNSQRSYVTAPYSRVNPFVSFYLHTYIIPLFHDISLCLHTIFVVMLHNFILTIGFEKLQPQPFYESGCNIIICRGRRMFFICRSPLLAVKFMSCRFFGIKNYKSVIRQ